MLQTVMKYLYFSRQIAGATRVVNEKDYCFENVML